MPEGRWPQGDWSQVSEPERIGVEDLLRALLEFEYRREQAGDAMIGAMAAMPHEKALPRLILAERCGMVLREGSIWTLTSQGRDLAVLVMRAHRLMETNLALHSSVPAQQWHSIAHREEHSLNREEVDQLAIRLGHPRFDPHGDPIPTKEGLLPDPEGSELLLWPEGKPAQIAHIEDEPAALYRELAERGLYAGMRLERSACIEGLCRIRVEAKTFILPGELAALMRVRPLPPEEEPVPTDSFRLSELKQGARARVLRLLPGCMGSERSRLLDLGFVPGSLIEHDLSNPLGGSTAYRVRGTLIALRDSQAEQILAAPPVQP